MKRTLLNPPGLSAPRGAYSHGVKVETGEATWVYLTGQLAIDGSGNTVAPFDVAQQTEFIFAQIGTLLAEAGLGYEDVVRSQTYMLDLNQYAQFTPIRDRYFAACRPASTLIEVKGLARKDTVVEVEITAVK